MATTAKIKLAFNYPQWQAFRAVGERQLVFLGFGRGVGKSHFLRTLWWMQVAKWDGVKRTGALKPFKGVRIIVFMPTLTQFKDVHWAAIENDLGPNGEWEFLGARLDRSRGHIVFPGGSWLKPFPASAYNARTALGMRGDILCGDECDNIDCDVYDSVAVPFLSEPWSLGMEWLAGTPTRGRHGLWWRTLQAGRLGHQLRSGKVSEADALKLPIVTAIRDVFENLSDKEWPDHLPHDPELAALEVLRGYHSFHATYKDAPETVSPLAVARAKATTPPATFKREWEADPDAGEGLIYAFDEEFHVREPPERDHFSEFHAGMDFGDEDPGVLLLGGVRGHGADAELWIIDEWYEQHCPNSVWDDRAKEWRYAKFWPDASRKDRVRDLRGLGLVVGETDKGPGSVLGGIARVANLLHIRVREVVGPAFQPIVQRYAKLYVSPKCKQTIREFGLYRRKKRPDGSFHEEPEDKDNHAMDALRYLCLGRFGRMRNVRSEQSGS